MADEAGSMLLLHRAVKGDRDALESLLIYFFDRLVAKVSRRLPNDVRALLSAEDVVQEAFIVAFQRIRELEPKGEIAFFSWLSRIAEHCLMDAVKALRAAKRGGGSQPAIDGSRDESSHQVAILEWLATHSWTASRSIARREDIDRLEKAIQSLDPDHCRVLRMRYIENLPIAAIGESMSRSEGAVHMLLSRALLALRSRL